MRKRGAETSPLVHASRELLMRGDAAGADQVLGPVFAQFRSDPDVLHLMGSIKKAQGKLDEAERHYRAAISLALSEGPYYHDLGLVLQKRGDFEEALRVFRAAQALMPQIMAVKVSLVRCLMDSGDLAGAEHEARSLVDADASAESWTLLYRVQRAQGRDEAALGSASEALKCDPVLRGVRYNYAFALDRVGRPGEALEYYERLARQELDSPDLALNFARALYAAGRKEDAETTLEQGLALWPRAVSLHGTLARMRFLRGEAANSVAHIEAAIAERPRDLNLRLACADALHRGGHLPRAARILEEAIRLAPDATPLLTAFGVILDELDRPIDGLRALRRVCQIAPDSRVARRNVLSTLLRAGCAEEALAAVRALRGQQPDEQYLIACEVTALRILEDPAYRYWADYERLVRSYEIAPPRGSFTIDDFNAALAGALRTQHSVNAHPLDQTIQHGSQTARNLLDLQERSIRALIAAVDSAVRDYVTRLRASPNDPLGQRKKSGYRYANLWSVRLNDGGHLPNHVHDLGWISSAYYVALSPSEKAEPRAGWLKLGEPNRPIVRCTPEKFIEPKPGMLVLFPSYFWHGTVPFSGSERLSAAFDVIPA